MSTKQEQLFDDDVDGQSEREYDDVPFENYEKKIKDTLIDILVIAGCVLGILWLVDTLIVRIPGLGTTAIVCAFTWIGVAFLYVFGRSFIGDRVNALPRVEINFRYPPGMEECYSENGYPRSKMNPAALMLNKIYGIVQVRRVVHDPAKLESIIKKEEKDPDKKAVLLAQVAKYANVDMSRIYEYHVKIDRDSYNKLRDSRNGTVSTFHEIIVYTPVEWKLAVDYQPGQVWGGGFNYKHAQTSSIELTLCQGVASKENTVLGKVPTFVMTACPWYQVHRTEVLLTRDEEIVGLLDAYAHFYSMADSRSNTIKKQLADVKSKLEDSKELDIYNEISDEVDRMKVKAKMDVSKRLRDTKENAEAKAETKKNAALYIVLGFLVVIIFVLVL